MTVDQGKIHVARGVLGPEHIAFMTAKKSSSYTENRGLAAIWAGLPPFYFDIPQYLRSVHEREGRVLELLDSGCGNGNMGSQIKSGVPAYQIYTPTKNELGFYEAHHTEIEADPGLGSAIRVTGITLSENHAEHAIANELDMDEMIVGAIEHYDFDRQFDFILDYTGPACYFPRRAIPIYKKLLRPEGLLFARMLFDEEAKYWEKSFPYFIPEELLRENGFNIVASGNYNYLLSLEPRRADELPVVRFRTE